MTLFEAVVYTLLVCGAVALVYWAVPRMQTPEPLARIVLVLAMIIGIAIVVFIVLSMIGMAKMPVQSIGANDGIFSVVAMIA